MPLRWNNQQEIITRMDLYPGPPVPGGGETVIRQLIENFGWILPTAYGDFTPDRKLETQDRRETTDKILECYARYGRVTFARDEDFLILHPSHPPQPPFAGELFLSLSAQADNFSPDSATDLFTLAQLLHPAVGFSGAREMYAEAQFRLVLREGYKERLPTVENYTRGLPAAFWRMWFGKEYIAWFGKDRLDAVPAYQKHYAEGLYFIQLYQSPYAWNTPPALEAVESFKEAVGRNAFYDPLQPQKKLQAPDFSHRL